MPETATVTQRGHDDERAAATSTNGLAAAATHTNAPAVTTVRAVATDGVAVPMRFFFIALAYLVVLVAVFALYHLSAGFRAALPDTLGVLPVGVPWFGAIGGALVTMTATCEHRHDWNPDFEYWHYARPWVGGIVGSMGGLLLYVIANAAAAGDSLGLDDLTFCVAAFVIGYREATFRQLIKRVTDLIIGPNGDDGRTAGNPTSGH